MTWSGTRLKYVAEVNKLVLSEDTSDDFEFKYVDIGNVTQGAVNTAMSAITFAKAPSRARRLAEPGDSIVSTVRTYLRAVATVPQSTEALVFSTGFAVLHPYGVVPQFLSWYLQGDEFVSRIEASSTGVSYPAITANQLMALDLRLPSEGEQRAIAKFLDRETARIDTLIEEQQRLIGTLRERLAAVIVRAATKGLSRSDDLVDSGVAWIGEVPERWSVKALRRCGALVTGSTPPTDDDGNFDSVANDRPWVRPQDLSSETTASAWLTEEGWSLLRPVPAGSVLVGCIAYSLGSVGYLTATATTNQQITSIIPIEHGKYLYYVLRAGKDELWASSQLNRVPILNNQRLGAIKVPVPPIEEQRRIAAYLDDQTSKIHSLIAETERFIELARERRSALITAAVTGQIDVRNEVA